MPITHKLTLDVRKRTIIGQQRVVVRQGEAGTQQIEAAITKDGEPYASSCTGARLEVLHADGTWARVTAAKSGTGVTVTLPSAAINAPGTCRLAHFVFHTGETTVETTEGFELRILPAVDVSGGQSKPYSDEIEALKAKWAEFEAGAHKAEAGRVEAEKKRAVESRKATDAANAAANEARAVIAQLPLPDGNIPRGHARGEVASADDAFSAAMLGLTMYGKTQRNLWVNPVGKLGGYTATENPDGTLTVTGTGVGDSYVGTTTHSLTPGQKYRLSVNKPLGAGFSLQVIPLDSEGHEVGGSRIQFGGTVSTVSTGTMPDGAASFLLRVQGTRGAEADIRDLCVMLEPDNGRTSEWVRPGLSSAAPSRIISAGPNIATRGSVTSNGITMTANGDGTISLSGTATVRFGLQICTVAVSPGMRVHASIDKKLSDNYSAGGIGACISVTEKTRGGVYVADSAFGVADNLKTSFVAGRRTGSVSIGFTFNQGASVSGTFKIDFGVGDDRGWSAPSAHRETAIDLKSNALRSLPDGTRDELRIDQTGKVTLVQRVGVRVLDGTQTVNTAPSDPSAGYFFTAFGGIGNYTDTSGKFDADRIATGSGGWDGTVHASYKFSQIHIFPPSSVAGYPVSEEGKAAVSNWLKSNRITVLYLLDQPKTVDLGTIAMPKLPQEAARVWTDAEVAPGLDAEYTRDINIVIKKLEQAIVASASNL